jgi:hypothetical protein
MYVKTKDAIMQVFENKENNCINLPLKENIA